MLSCADNFWGIEGLQAGHDISVVCEVVLCFGVSANPDATLVSCAGIYSEGLVRSCATKSALCLGESRRLRR